MGRLQEGNGLRCRKLGEHQEPWGIHAAGATGDAWGLPSDWESNRNRGATRAAAANGAGWTLLGSVEKLGVPAVKVTSEQGWAWASRVDCSRHPQTLDAPPGTLGYCTELTLNDLKAALAAADKRRAPENREVLIKEFAAAGAKLTHDEMVARKCAVPA